MGVLPHGLQYSNFVIKRFHRLLLNPRIEHLDGDRNLLRGYQPFVHSAESPLPKLLLLVQQNLIGDVLKLFLLH